MPYPKTGLIHGIEPMPWDGAKGQVLMSAGFVGIYLHRFAGGSWTPTEMSKGAPDPWPKSGASDIALGKLWAQKFYATIEPWHGNQIVVYRQQHGAFRSVEELWTQSTHATLSIRSQSHWRSRASRLLALKSSGPAALILTSSSSRWQINSVRLVSS